MSVNRLAFLLGLLVLFVGMPTAANAQDDPECIWCYECPEPWEYLMYTEDSPGPDLILFPLGEFDCRPYEEGSCREMIPCEPGEDEEEEQAELLALIQEGDASSLKKFLEEKEDHLVRVQDRNLLLFRGGCKDEVIGVFQLDPELFAEIE